MDLWIPITIAATVIQNVRAVGQRWLLGRVSVGAAAYGRFFYGFPLTLLFLIAVCAIDGRAPPAPSLRFLAFATVGALSQSLGNEMFVRLVRSSNFIVMTTYSKMETVFSPVFSFFLLDDRLSVAGVTGIVVAVLGVMLMASARSASSLGALIGACLRAPASQGILVGAIYAVTSTSYRAAAFEVGDVGFAMQGLTLLAWATGIQAVAGGIYLAWQGSPVLSEVFREWRYVVWIGITGVSASACWLCAFALQKTGYVLAVGQIELVFAFVASHLLFKERAHRNELVGILVTVVGILLVVMAR